MCTPQTDSDNHTNILLMDGEPDDRLTGNVHRLTFDDRQIILVGTAHVSRVSADLVEQVIREEKPDVICVELCKPRLDAIRHKDTWQEMDIVKVIREKRAALLLSQLLMVSFQRKIARKFNICPGEDMLRAISLAEETDAEIVPVDRDVRVTLMRVWRKMNFRSKTKIIPEMLLSLFVTHDITEEDIERLKDRDMLELAVKMMGETWPDLKTIAINERDQYLSHAIAHASGHKIVVVVGAGHIPGIIANMGKEIDMDALNQIPPRSRWSKLARWVFSMAILGLFIAGFFYSSSDASMSMIMWWTLITATCAAIGALILLAHPLTIAASILSAPITTLHPLIAAGWVAGFVEAMVRKPQVKDFLNLTHDVTTLKGFFRNRITRILLLVAFVNLTTSIGTFVAIPVIMRFF